MFDAGSMMSEHEPPAIAAELQLVDASGVVTPAQAITISVTIIVTDLSRYGRVVTPAQATPVSVTIIVVA